MFNDNVDFTNLCNYAVKSLCCVGFSKELINFLNKMKHFKRKVNIFMLQMRLIFRVFFMVICATPAVLLAQSNQTGLVKGTLKDSTLALKGATVSVLKAKDSTLLRYGMSNSNGYFQIDNLPFGNYILRITYSGYQQVDEPFVLGAETSEKNMGIIPMVKFSTVLDGIIIRAAAMAINGDTTEFNASQFKTIPNASTEDLLKKMPGIEVDRDGSIKTQGEPVTRILVDGKPFYGNDPKMATRNLPADIIEKIQVIDAVSDQSAFSGFDDGNRIRTINIITKKDRKKGLFGKGSAALGNEGRYAHAVSANRINGGQKFSFIGQMNNINNQNFSVQDFLGTGGQAGGGNSASPNGSTNVFNGNSSGISTTKGGGMNYDDQWGKYTKVSGSYFYSDIFSNTNRDRLRETYVVNDSSLYSSSKIFSGSTNKNHKANIEIDHMFDSSNTILIKSSFNSQLSDVSSISSSTATKGKLLPINALSTVNKYFSQGYNVYSSILYRHKFNKRGRTMSLYLSHGANESERESRNLSFNNRYNKGVDTLDQVTETYTDGMKYGASLSYTEPLSIKSQLEFSYKYSYNAGRSDQLANKLDKLTRVYTIIVPSLTNAFENDNKAHRSGVSYRRQVSPLWNYVAGLAVQKATLTSNNKTTKSDLKNSFVDLFPSFFLQYRKGRSQSLRLNYRGYTVQPYVTQLQDVVNNSSIMYVRAGNPLLKQEFTNSMEATYSFLNKRKTNNLSVTMNASTTARKISNAITLNTTGANLLVDGYSLPNGAQYIKPLNLDGAYASGVNIYYSISMKNPKSSINIMSWINNSKEVSLFNAVKGYTFRNTYGGRLSFNLNLKDWLDLGLSGNSTVNFIQYTIAGRKNANFYNHRISAEPTINTKKGWLFTNDFDYIMFRGNASAINQSIPLWNAGVAKLFGQARKAELRLTIFDLLNANKSIYRNVELNYIEDVRQEVLNRYFLLSFTYHLRKFNGGQRSKR